MRRFVLGDRDGTTCEPEFTDFVAGVLRGRGYTVRINEIYKGVEIVKRQGRPAEQRHSLQIEVDRTLYMDQKTLERSEDFARLQADITHLIEALKVFCEQPARRLHPRCRGRLGWKLGFISCNPLFVRQRCRPSARCDFCPQRRGWRNYRAKLVEA